MMIEVYIVLFALANIFLLCVMGIFYEKYDDNWGQRIGLVVVGMSSVLLSRLIWDRMWVSPEAMWFILGSWSFAVGTALKVWRHRKSPEKKRTLHTKQRV